MIMGIIGYSERDSWEFIRDGRETLNKVLEAAESGCVDGRELFLWSSSFRRIFDKTYSESSQDRSRPIRKLRRGCNRNVVAIAREWMETGQAEAVAKRLSQELGFRVFPDMTSLVYAGEIKYERLLAEL